MQNNLEKLRIALDNRNTTRERLAELQASGDGSNASKLGEEREKLARRETSLQRTREMVKRELADVCKASDEAKARLQKARDTRTVSFETAEEHRLKASIERGGLLIDHLEKALAAESPGQVQDILATIQEEASSIPGTFSMDSSRFGDWPGPSVPERLIMLFKEARHPGSKKPILFSGGLMALLAVVVLGGATISMLRAEPSGINAVGVGEAVVPVMINAADEAVSIEVTLGYDEGILTAREVRQGLMSTLGRIAFDVSTPGKVSFVVEDEAGMVGSGDLALVVFKVETIVDDPVVIDLVYASATNKDGSQAAISLEDGWLKTETMVNYAPVIRFESED